MGSRRRVGAGPLGIVYAVVLRYIQTTKDIHYYLVRRMITHMVLAFPRQERYVFTRDKYVLVSGASFMSYSSTASPHRQHDRRQRQARCQQVHHLGGATAVLRTHMQYCNAFGEKCF